MTKYDLLFLFFLLFCSTLRGQDEGKNPASIAIKSHYGLILPHSSKVEPLTHSHPWGVELEYAWIMLKESNWQQCNCYSKMGVSLFYVNYGNPDVVGSSYNLIGFAEPFLWRSGKLIFSARMGVGISFLDKIYDEQTNPDNQFFSTPLSFLVHLDGNIYYTLTGKWKLMLFAKYSHISNGGIKEPNYGMNFPTFGLGFTYQPGGKTDFKERDKEVFRPSFFYGIYSFGTLESVSADDEHPEQSALVAGMYGLAGRAVSKLNGFSAGLDYVYDGAKKEELSRAGVSRDHQQLSLLLGHHLQFGKFDFSQHWGTYLYAPDKPRNFFQRYSLTFRIGRHLALGATLKAHGDAADNFNVLVGVVF
ncbi:MAG: acyloxyacyl hydrolase [Bacteroidales bacterium]|nr:acyloxyacyl hydrolase [Bacteroidales bacterium]